MDRQGSRNNRQLAPPVPRYGTHRSPAHPIANPRDALSEDEPFHLSQESSVLGRGHHKVQGNCHHRARLWVQPARQVRFGSPEEGRLSGRPVRLLTSQTRTEWRRNDQVQDHERFLLPLQTRRTPQSRVWWRIWSCRALCVRQPRRGDCSVCGQRCAESGTGHHQDVLLYRI